MIAIVRTTVWAAVGGLWGAALATKGSTEAWNHAAQVGTTIGVVAGAAVGLVMQVVMRRIRMRRRGKHPDA
jgi:hypothetical protein